MLKKEAKGFDVPKKEAKGFDVPKNSSKVARGSPLKVYLKLPGPLEDERGRETERWRREEETERRPEDTGYHESKQV